MLPVSKGNSRTQKCQPPGALYCQGRRSAISVEQKQREIHRALAVVSSFAGVEGNDFPGRIDDNLGIYRKSICNN